MSTSLHSQSVGLTASFCHVSFASGPKDGSTSRSLLVCGVPILLAYVANQDGDAKLFLRVYDVAIGKGQWDGCLQKL